MSGNTKDCKAHVGDENLKQLQLEVEKHSGSTSGLISAKITREFCAKKSNFAILAKKHKAIFLILQKPFYFKSSVRSTAEKQGKQKYSRGKSGT